MYYWLRAVHHHNDMREMDFFREKSLALKSQAFDTPLFYTCRLYKKDGVSVTRLLLALLKSAFILAILKIFW